MRSFDVVALDPGTSFDKFVVGKDNKLKFPFKPTIKL